MSEDNRLLLPPASSDATGSDSEVPGSPERGVSPCGAPEDPANRTTGQRRVAFFTVIVTEALERTAFYSLVCNMVLFLNSDPLGWASYHAAFALFTFNGLSYVFTLFGGWVADAFCGKYPTILVAFVVYIAGCAAWPLLYPYPDVTFMSNCSPSNKDHWCASNNFSLQNSTMVQLPEENCAWVVFLAIAVISCGYGCVRVNIIPFGAHQIEHEGPMATRFYFNWLYWFINVGSFIAFGGMGYIQQNISYFYGYLVPGLILILAVLIFISGSRFYIKKREAHGSILTNIFGVCLNAMKVSCHESRGRDIEIITSEPRPYDKAPCCIDYAKMRYGGRFSDNAVNDVKALGRVVLVFVSIIPYWTIYYQMQTTFMVQGLHMELGFGTNTNATTTDNGGFKIPASWLSMFDIIFVLLLLPLLDRVIYPRLDRAGRSPSLRCRILIGMLFAIAAMLVAGAVEHYRLLSIWPGKDQKTANVHEQLIGCTTYDASEMSILWQIPQYALVGISEIFTSTAGLELAFIAAPRSLKGVIMGLYWFCEGIGALLGSASIAIFENVWFPKYDHGNINCETSPFTTNAKCHLDYYFYTLAGFQLIGVLIFIVVAWALNIGQSIPLRVQEQGVTVVRSSDRTPQPLLSPSSMHDTPGTSTVSNHLQRRNAESMPS